MGHHALSEMLTINDIIIVAVFVAAVPLVILSFVAAWMEDMLRWDKDGQTGQVAYRSWSLEPAAILAGKGVKKSKSVRQAGKHKANKRIASE